MAKFATVQSKVPTPGKIAPPAFRHTPTTTGERIMGHEGAGWARDAKSELFLFAISNMVSEDTFYEDGKAGQSRFVDLIHKAVHQDPEWVAAFVPYLRDTMNMRSASIVVAAEYVAAGGPKGRPVISSALQRADEPAEMLAYWHAAHGRNEPAAVKRGVADAVQRLYTERNTLRYDGAERPWRFGDVLDRVHAKKRFPEQGALYKHLIDRRHGHGDVIPEALTVLRADQMLRTMPENQRRAALGGALWEHAGWSWERLSGWLPGGMDAQAWEAVIPNMGYMALLRNLRNFDQAGISARAQNTVADRLMDADQVARSRQFPIRFLSAWREVESMRWAPVLEQALEHSLVNVPKLDGRTLILVDLSGSMWCQLSGRSKRMRWEVALLFGAALAKRAEQADLIVYGSDHQAVANVRRPVLRTLEEYGHGMGGTNTFGTLARTYRDHDRVIIITDEQAHDVGFNHGVEAPIITFNVGGYRAAHVGTQDGKNWTIGGLSDAGFKLLPMLETVARDGVPELARG